MELTLPIDDTDKLARFDDVLFEMIGGRDVAEMLVQHYMDNMSVRAIARVHAEPEPNVRRWISQARTKMRRCGVFPKSWEKQCPTPSTA